MEKTNLFLGSILAGMAVAAGAFGAHGLQQITKDAQVLHTYQTAVQYHFGTLLRYWSVAPFQQLRTQY